MNTIGELLSEMRQKPLDVAPDSTVDDTIEILAGNDIGVVIVLDESGCLVGIVSERDIVHAYAKRCPDIGDTPVSELMSRDLVTCDTREIVSTSIAKMLHHRIRHLPVVDDGAFLGVVSMRDLLFAWMEKDHIDRGALAQLIDALTAINQENGDSAEIAPDPEVAASIG